MGCFLEVYSVCLPLGSELACRWGQPVCALCVISDQRLEVCGLNGICKQLRAARAFDSGLHAKAPGIADVYAASFLSGGFKGSIRCFDWRRWRISKLGWRRRLS